MIGPVKASTTTILSLNTLLRACNRNTLDLARDCLSATKLGVELHAQMNKQLPSMSIHEPVAKMLILFLKSINDQDSLASIRSKLLSLYHEAITDARMQNDYKILNYICCEYCQFVAQHCSDLNEIGNALAIQEDLLDDINYGINFIDISVYADSYEEQLRRHLQLIAKYHEININFDGSTSDVMDSLSYELCCITFRKKSGEKTQIANYHASYLMMRVDSLELFNLQRAYTTLKTLLKEKLPEPFASKVRFRLAELIRLAQNEDIEKDVNGFAEMKELYYKVIFGENDLQLKAKAQYSLSQIYNRPELFHGVDPGLTKIALKQVLLKTAPSSLLATLSYFQLGELLIFGTNKDDAEPIEGRKYLTHALQCNLLNEFIQAKLCSLCRMKTEGDASINEIHNATGNMPSLSRLTEIRKKLVMAMDSSIEDSYHKSEIFYARNTQFCIDNKNFNTAFLQKRKDVLLELEKNNFSLEQRFAIPINGIDLFKEHLDESFFQNLYAADRLTEANPELSLHLYQTNLSIVFLLLTFKIACIRKHILEKMYKIPTSLFQSAVRGGDNHFFSDFSHTPGQEAQNSLFKLLEDPTNIGIFRGILGAVQRYVLNIFDKNQYELLSKKVVVNDCEFQPTKIPTKEMALVVIAREWELLKNLPLHPAYRSGIIQKLSLLRYLISSLNINQVPVTNSKTSQDQLITDIILSKFVYSTNKKVKYLMKPMSSIKLNTGLFNLAGLLPNDDKYTLFLEIARFNRSQFENMVFIPKLEFTYSYYLSIAAYLKAFKLESSTKNKIEILDELFSFGAKTGDDFVELIDSLKKIRAEDRNEFEVTAALLISCRIEYLLFLNQPAEAEELINKIKATEFHFVNSKGVFELFADDLITIESHTEGKYTFQLYSNDLKKRKEVLSTIGPFSPAYINYQFEIPFKPLQKKVISSTSQQPKSQKMNCSSPTRNAQRKPKNTPVETDSYENYNTSPNRASETSMSKKAAAEQLQKIEAKKLLKEQRSNANINSPSKIASHEITSDTSTKAEVPSITISKEAKLIFDKLWIPHKGAINLKSDSFDAKNYTSDSVLHKDELIFLVGSLGGSYVSGRGSHEKCILSSIDHTDKIIIKGETIHISNFASIERATQPLPKEKSGKDFLDGFLIIQFRSKLVQLGYTPLTVKSKAEG